jgi:hypothetical protein
MAKQLTKLEQYEANKKSTAQARQDEIQLMNYNGAQNFDELYDGLSSAEIKFLYTFNQSFHDTTDLLNSPQSQTLAASPEEAQEIRDQRRAAEQNRLFTESREAEEANVREEKLYHGVEKLADGRYRLTIDPGDGTSPEVFYGATQAEVWDALRKSKANATKELRRRAKSVRITAELRAITPEIIEYPPLVEKITLTPAELYDYTAAQSDPLRSVEALRMLRLAGMTQAEVDRQNEVLIRSRMMEATSIADKWMKENPEFYKCPENIKAMIDLMGESGLNWAVTSHNLDLSFDALKEQEVLVTRPEEGVAVPVIPQSRPRPATFALPAAVPSPAAPQAQRPAAPLRRPTMHDPSRVSFARRSSAPIKAAPMTATEYQSISSSDMKEKYTKDANFKDRVDAYWAAGGR